MEKDFHLVMAGRTKEQLLAILRESYDYVPEAVVAARDELMRRGVNGFDIAAATDVAEYNAIQIAQHAEQTLAWKQVLLWLVLPILALTPLGPIRFRKYAEEGYRRKSIQLMETIFIGFSVYLLGFILLLRLAKP